MKSSARIYGGEEATPHSIPWQVAIFDHYVNDSDPACGGTLISAKHVLTAAHCVEDNTDCSRYSVGIGMHNRNGSDGKRVDIDHISNHPHYHNLCGTNITDFDFSILHLNIQHFHIHMNNGITFNNKVIPACLPDKSFGGDFLDGKILTVSGWGKPFYANLQKGTLPGVTNKDCSIMNDAKCTYITENMLCAGNSKNRKVGHYFGDSGGSIQC